MFSAEPVCSCALSFVQLHARPRVQRASGIPCSLQFEGHETQTSGISRRENADVYLLFDIRIDFFLVIASSFGTDRGADTGGRNKHRGRPA